ncbi:MAG: hypothetical protein HQ509_00190 [Candidatus Marinimicrobia bacterium]|nr:hypothetical protein [Candidatus Neomarinimicrobiota bacterium]
MKKTLTNILFLALGMITAQGCYTQMVVERKVVIIPERQIVETVVTMEEEPSLVHEYHYWFNNPPNYYSQSNYPGYYTGGFYIDISWYDPFYDPWYAYQPYQYYDPWFSYQPFYGHGYGCNCHGYYNSWNNHGSSWWTGNYGGHHGGHGYNEPQPPKKPRDWDRRGQDDFTGIQRGVTPSSSGVILTGTTPISSSTGNERPSLTRKPVESTKTTKIEKSREPKGFEIKRTKKSKSSSGVIKRKETKSNKSKSKSVRPSKTTKKDKSVRPSKRSKSRDTKVSRKTTKSSRSTRKPNRG